MSHFYLQLLFQKVASVVLLSEKYAEMHIGFNVTLSLNMSSVNKNLNSLTTFYKILHYQLSLKYVPQFSSSFMRVDGWMVRADLIGTSVLQTCLERTA